MRRCFVWLLALVMLGTATAFAAERGETVTVAFEIVDNEFGAISARVGMAFDPDVFEFVSAERISRDVLNSAPKAADDRYGLVNLGGISAGVLGTVTLRIRESAPAGAWEVAPVVDSVYNARKQPVTLNVKGETIYLDHAWAQEPTAGEEENRCIICGQPFRGEGSLVPGLDRLPGDANGDGQVSSLDALSIFKYSTGWKLDIDLSNADVNADGAADVFDALLILQFGIGRDVTLK